MAPRAKFRIIIAVGIVAGIAKVGVPVASQWSGTITDKTSHVQWTRLFGASAHGDPQTYEVIVACDDGNQRVGHIEDMATWMALKPGDKVVKARRSFDAIPYEQWESARAREDFRRKE